MATERENFEIFVRLLGIPEMQAQARAGAEAMSREWAKVFDQDIAAGGGAPAALRGREAQLAAQLSAAQTARQRAQRELDALVAGDPTARRLNEALDKPMRYTKAGEPYAQDVAAKRNALARVEAKDTEVALQVLAAREKLLAAMGREQGVQGQLITAQDKRIKAEFEASDAGQMIANYKKLDAQRQREMPGYLARLEREKAAAEAAAVKAAQKEAKERDASAAAIERQRRRAEARTAELEHKARTANPFAGTPLTDYTRPLAEGLHEPARTRVALAQTESQYQSVLRNITEIYRRAHAGELTGIAAEQAMEAARRQLTAVTRRRAELEDRLSAEAGGFRSQFARGFRGASDRPYAEQLGQAVKFSAFYGAAYRIQFALLQTFRDAFTEGVEFEQGLSDLALATGQTKDQLTTVGNQLAQTASAAGVSPSQGLAIGARAIGLYGLAGSPDRAQQDYVANLSAQVVSKLTLGGKADPVVVQQNLAAITQALGIGAAGQLRVADLDAYFSKRFGTTPGGTLESGAQSASVGIAAGFSLEEVQAAAALMISRTGQSSSAIGGYLAQIFSRGGEGSLTGVAQKYGIETQGRQLADVFSELAAKYQESGSAAQAEIAAAFGRGKVQNAVVTLLQSFQEVQDEANKARDGAADGALERSFSERINNIGGQIAVLGGHFKEFARLIGQSGMLAILGIAVEVLDQLVTSASAVLRVFNQLPESVRILLGLIATASLARRVGIGAGAAGVLDGLVGQTAARGAATTGVRGLLNLGVTAARAAGPLAAFTGLVFGAGKTLESIANIKQQVEAGAQALLQAPGYNATPVELSTYASLLNDQARQLRESDNGLWGNIADALTAGDPDRQAALLEKQAKHAEEQAKHLASIARPDERGIIPDLSKEGIASGLDRVTATGGGAAQRLNALRIAIEGVGGAAEAASTQIDPKKLEFALTSITKDLPDKIKFDLNELDTPDFKAALEAGNPVAQYYDALGSLDTSKITPELQAALPPDKLAEILLANLKAQGITDFKNLTPEAAAQAADAAVAEIEVGGDINTQNLSAVQDAYAKVIREALLKEGENVVSLIDGVEKLTNEEVTTALQGLVEEVAGKLSTRDTVDYGGRLRDIRTGLRLARRAASVAADSDLPIIITTIRDFERQAVAVQIERLEALRSAAVANASSQAEATRIGRSFVRREIRAIVRGGGSGDQLVEVLSTAGRGAIAVARAAIEAALKVARAAAAVQAQLGAALSSIPDIWGNLPDADGKGPATKEIKRLQGLLDSLQYVTPDANPDQLPGGSADEGETAAQRRAARLAAQAARKGGDIAAAQAAVASAKADLQDAEKGSVAYYNALASYYQAKDQLNEAFRNYRNILRQLKIDTTDPLAQANLALAEARRKLRQDIRRGKGRDVIAQDRLDVKNAQNEAEATAFSQRLEDVQTAEELGRISHSAYLRYLQSEHNRLTAIAKRTRQQQDQLNQIDKLMKDAAGEMQGAFNIGDINLPTPYEVRRFIKTQISATPYSLGPNATTGTTTIYINGADTGAVKRIIDDTVGRGTRVLTTTPRRN